MIVPKVSVIIPAYNAMKYLPETLETVLRQIYKDFEVIIINDGSSDGIKQWAARIEDPRVKLISQENRGLAGARNTGLRNALGEYIAYLDADDIWEPTKLEKQVRVLEENPEVGLVYTWTERINEDGKSIGKPFKVSLEGNIWEKLLEKNFISPSSAMIRRSCFQIVGMFDESLNAFGEDWDMWLRIAYHYPFKVLKEPLYSYREHQTSASKNYKAMERGQLVVIERTFASAPPALQHLKRRSYSFAYCHLASQCLQSQNPDYKIASNFLKQALAHNPKLYFSKEYIRLNLAIALMGTFGIDSYRKLQTIFRAFRRRVFSTGEKSKLEKIYES